MLLMEKAHVLVKMKKFNQYLEVPPWPNGLRRLFFKPEIVGSGSSPGGARLYFQTFIINYILFHCKVPRNLFASAFGNLLYITCYSE